MRAPYFLPDYRCGACGMACYVRESKHGTEPHIARINCVSHHCDQRDKPLFIALPVAEVLPEQMDLMP